MESIPDVVVALRSAGDPRIITCSFLGHLLLVPEALSALPVPPGAVTRRVGRMIDCPTCADEQDGCQLGRGRPRREGVNAQQGLEKVQSAARAINAKTS